MTMRGYNVFVVCTRILRPAISSKSIKNGLFVKLLNIKISNVWDLLAAKYTVATSFLSVR